MPLARQVNAEDESARIERRFFDIETEDSGINPVAEARAKEIYQSETRPLPKFRIHQSGVSAALAAQLVHSHLSLDGNPALNLASFVHTGIDPHGLQLCQENITKNLADSDEYPAMLELQQRCVSIISNLWNVPKGEQGVGTATTGSSEAIMLGGLAMKRRWEAQRKAKGKPYDKPNVIMGANAQVALEKFARYFDCELRLLDCHASSHFSFSLEDLRKNVDENTIGVFVIMGSTYTGHYQDLEAIAKVLDDYEKETGNDVSIHVDGASGGFVAPFISPELKWDFRVPRVRSINASGHKFGLAPVGCGWIIWRDQKYLPENLLFTLSYLGGSETTYTLNFSRPGHPIIYQYYVLVKLGFLGYKAVHSTSLVNARMLSVLLEDSGYFDVLSDIHRPAGKIFSKSGEKTYDHDVDLSKKPHNFFNYGLPVVAFKLTDDFKAKYPYIPQEVISHMLRDKGYIIPNYPLPPAEDKNECLRIVINENMSVDLLDKLMEDILRVTNRAMKISKHIPHTDTSVGAVRRTIQIIAQADHALEEHEDLWEGKAEKKNTNHSRC